MVTAAPTAEYEGIYEHFAELLRSGRSHVDAAPLQLVVRLLHARPADRDGSISIASLSVSPGAPDASTRRQSMAPVS